MSRDVFVAHSSEVDKPNTLAEGWYVATAYPDESPAAERCVGPYSSKDDALNAMLQGDWINPL